MASSSSAVLEVVVENTDISTLFKEKKEYDRSSICSVSSVQNSLSPSLESFSTVQDIENLSELNIGDDSDLCVKVDNPQKILDTLETYITFRITTKVARIEFSENEYIVRRRYNDFVWLRQKLVEAHPFCIVPPLPAKHSLMGQLDRYSKNFVLIRMKALNTFIQRIVQHPILSCNENFKIFITAKQGQFSLCQKHRKNSDRQLQILNGSISSHSTLKIRNMEFDKVKNYLTTLHEKLTSIEKVSSRINRERQDFVSELNSYHPIFSTWATFESELAPLLKSIAHAIEKSSAAQSNLIFSYPTVLVNPVKELLLYVDVVQGVLRKREAYQYAYESSVVELNRKHDEKDKLIMVSQNSSQGASGFSFFKQPSNDDKLEKLGIFIPQLLKKVETNQDSLERANECLRSDLSHWQQEKQSILKKILLDFVNKQIEYYTASVNAWEQVTNEFSTLSENGASSTAK